MTTGTGSGIVSAGEKLDAVSKEYSEKKPSNGATRTLDDWLADGESEEEESEETSEEESSEEETDSGEEEESSTDEGDNDAHERQRLVT
jgi:hypothetical protein